MERLDNQYADLDLYLEPGDDFNLLDTDSTLSSQDLSRKRPSENDLEDQFLPGTEEYRKARKRKQNRESAARNRARKKSDFYQLESDIEKLTQENRRLMLENQSLKTENEILKKELSFYVSVVGNTGENVKSKSGGTLSSAVLASVLCVCFLFQMVPGQGAKQTEGRKPLGIEESRSFSVVSYLGLVAVCIGVMWALKTWQQSTKVKVLV